MPLSLIRCHAGEPVFFRPASGPSDVGKLGEKSEKHEHEHPVKVVPNSFGVTGIGNFLKNAKQGMKRLGIHNNLHAKMSDPVKNGLRGRPPRSIRYKT